jgi:DNA-directed RNA polymerase specialized sigma24 family protein
MTEYARIADERLRQLHEAEYEIKECMQRIEELENLAQCCSSLNITDKVQTSLKGSKLEESVLLILEEQERLKAVLEQWLSLKKDISQEIETLDPLLRDVLNHRYVLRHSTEQTAEELSYSESHTKRLKRQALEALGEKISKKKEINA